MSCWRDLRTRLVALTLGVVALAGAGSPLQGDDTYMAEQSQTQPAPPPAEPLQAEEPFEFVPPPVVPEEFFLAMAYFGSYREAWNTQALLDPILGEIFLKLQSGATREQLSALEIPDLDLALEDLLSARMVRREGDRYHPAFPVIREEAGGKALDDAVRAAADGIYPELRGHLKKLKKAAAKEKLAPWLYTLVWAEVLMSRGGEEILLDAGALDSRRMRDEGYLWVKLPLDPFLLGVDRYGSGSETLHYLWNPRSYLNPVVQDFEMRWRILDGALAPVPWSDSASEEAMAGFGILTGKKVAVPALKKTSRLLALLRPASQLYAKRALASLRPDALAKALGISRDEAFAAAFSSLGFRIMERAVADGLLRPPDYLAVDYSPSTKLVETLVVTPDETFHSLEHAYYLYDKNDFTGSIRQAEAYLQDHPDDPEALFRKGIAHMKLRKYPEALEAFQRGVALPALPDDVWRGWFLIREGNTLDMLDRRDEALTRYEKALTYADVNASHQWARQWLEYVYRD